MDNKIYLYEALILISLWPIYIIFNFLISEKNTHNIDEEKLDLNSEKEENNIKYINFYLIFQRINKFPKISTLLNLILTLTHL